MKKRKNLVAEGGIVLFRFMVTLVLMLGFVFFVSKIDMMELTNSVFDIEIQNLFT